MSLLSRDDILEARKLPLEERLVITPLLDEHQIGPGTVDLRLGTDFLVLRRTKGSGLDPGTQGQSDFDDHYERVVVPVGEKLWLHPQDFLLAGTLEFIRLPPDLGASVNSRSSWGRLGLIVATAIFVQPGFSGCLTLELANEGNSPIPLYPGLAVAQLAISRTEQPCQEPYGTSGRYRAPTRPQAARLEKDHQAIQHLRSVHARLASRLG
jgi:dCTP deaminase